MSQFALAESLWPASLPELHQQFLRQTIARFSKDPRLVGLAAGGSFCTDTLDQYSDLDLVVLVDSSFWPAILDDREKLVRPLGTLLAAFTGEHVGESRLLITLFGSPLLHVDFKFMRPADLIARVEDPIVLWERDGAVSAAMGEAPAVYPQPDAQWIEDRFWVWVHYLATKIGRGELFGALEGLTFLRGRVIGPLLLGAADQTPNGVRRLEEAVPASLSALRETATAHDRAAIVVALSATIQLYRGLRSSSVIARAAAEREAMIYLEAVTSAGAR